MKKIGFLVISLLLPLAMNAQQEEDDFSNFVKQQSADFDKFVERIRGGEACEEKG